MTNCGRCVGMNTVPLLTCRPNLELGRWRVDRKDHAWMGAGFIVEQIACLGVAAKNARLPIGRRFCFASSSLATARDYRRLDANRRVHFVPGEVAL